jgi:Tfp pilus assembly protein PilO
MDIEQALSDLSKQFAELKQEFTKLLKMRGIPGPRGPAGEIDAAVNNARDVAEQVAITAAKAAVVYPFRDEVKQVRAEFQELKSYLDERIENAIVNHVVQTLQDYGVLDENMNPLNKAHLNTHLKQLGILSN